MYVISVKSEELSRKEVQLKRIASAIESNKNCFSEISNSLDYDIKCKQNIYHELNILYKELDNIELQLYKFCNFLTETSEAYLEAELRLHSYTYRNSIEFNNYTKPPVLPDEKEESFFTRIGNKLKSGIKHLVSFLANSNERVNNSYDDEELLTWDEIDNTKKNSVFDYLERSGEQIVKGNYTDEVTLLGTIGQIALGILGLDAPMDARDIVCDFHKWEWTWGHAGKTVVDMASVLPFVGALKYTDEVGTLAKGVNKSSDLFKNIDKTDEIVDGIKNSKKISDSIRKVGNDILDIMESAGGHTLEKHVSRTNQDLIKRAIKENVEAATSYINKSTAIKAVQDNLRKNADEIADWLSNSNKAKKTFEVIHSNPVGKGVLSDKKTVIYNLTKSKVVLVKDATQKLGFRIITSFPVVK